MMDHVQHPVVKSNLPRPKIRIMNPLLFPSPSNSESSESHAGPPPASPIQWLLTDRQYHPHVPISAYDLGHCSVGILWCWSEACDLLLPGKEAVGGPQWQSLSSLPTPCHREEVFCLVSQYIPTLLYPRRTKIGLNCKPTSTMPWNYKRRTLHCTVRRDIFFPWLLIWALVGHVGVGGGCSCFCF